LRDLLGRLASAGSQSKPPSGNSASDVVATVESSRLACVVAMPTDRCVPSDSSLSPHAVNSPTANTTQAMFNALSTEIESVETHDAFYPKRGSGRKEGVQAAAS
jgi:hypothetical protein